MVGVFDERLLPDAAAGFTEDNTVAGIITMEHPISIHFVVPFGTCGGKSSLCSDGCKKESTDSENRSKDRFHKNVVYTNITFFMKP